MVDEPINYQPFVRMVQLALNTHDEIPEEAADEVLGAVQTAIKCDNDLMLRGDYDEFMATLDGVLDSIDGNGYGEQVTALDEIRKDLESEHDFYSTAKALTEALAAQKGD
jgi:hypothetical protein